MAKCGGCGKFLSTTDCVRCAKCPGAYHRACVGILNASPISPNWLCPGCKAKIPRVDNSATPVKSASESCLSDETPPTSQSVVSNPPASSPKSADLEVAHEIRSLREELNAMRMELREYRQEVLDLKTSVTVCNERVDEIENRMSDLEKRFEEKEPCSHSHLEGTIAELKLQLNDRDQDMLHNDIVITGIPESKDENPVHLFNLVALKLGVSVDERDLVNVQRIGAVRRNFTDSVTGADVVEPPRQRVIAVRLTRRAARDQLLRAARVRRGLTTADLSLQGQTNKIYVNERLTRYNSKLFYDARVAGQQNNFKYVWTKDGQILARKEDGKSAQRIRSDADLVRIFGNSSV